MPDSLILDSSMHDHAPKTAMRRKALTAAFIGLALLRVLLAAGQPMQAIGGADHDDDLFAHLASHLLSHQWLGPYDNVTLIKGPGYPIFMAANFWAGLPLYLSQTLFYLAACGAMVWAVRPFLRNGWALLLLFALMAFCPSSYEGQTYRVLREGIYPALTLFTLAALIGLCTVRGVWRRAALAVGAAASLCAFMVTREEGIWLSASVGLLLLVAAFRVAAAPGRRSLRLALAALVFAAPLAIAWSGVAWIKHENKRHYGVAVVTELSDGPFDEAYGAIIRVKPARWRPYLPAPREVREAIYAQSPAFASIKPYLENSPLTPAACEAIPSTCGDIGGGWFLWAVRDAASQAGYHQTAVKAAAYYERVAHEINDACDQKRLNCGPPHASPIPPLHEEHFRALPGALHRAVKVFVTYGVPIAHYSPAASWNDESRFPDIASLTHNTLAPPETVHFTVKSWAYHPAGPLTIQALDETGAPQGFRLVQAQSSPDVAKFLGRPDAGNVRYEAEFNGPKSVLQFSLGERVVGRIRFTRDEAPVPEILDPQFKAPTGSWAQSVGTIGSGITQTDTAAAAADAWNARWTLQHRLASFYGRFTPWIALPGLVAALILATRLLLGRSRTVVWVVGALLGAILARLLLIALADVTSMPSIQPKHFTAISPLLYVLIFLAIAGLFQTRAQAATTTAAGSTAKPYPVHPQRFPTASPTVRPVPAQRDLMTTPTTLEPVSIIIPAFNESGGIRETVEQVRGVFEGLGWPHELIVVDDGSVDGTGDIAEQAGATVIRHPRNRGYGAAIKNAIRKSKYDVIAITDADGTYPNERLPEMLTLLRDHDMVVGARTGDSVAIPLIRRPAKYFLRSLASYLVGQKIPDINSGLRVFRKEPAMRFIGLLPDGFSLTTTITLSMMSNNYSVEFVPINYFARVGSSKIRPIHDTIRFTNLTVRTVMYFQPLKIFGPVGLGLMGVGVLDSVYNVVAYHHLSSRDLFLLLGALNILAIGLLADLIDKRTA
jgi:glycosyltransferase involved in cell wall biosynthesis